MRLWCADPFAAVVYRNRHSNPFEGHIHHARVLDSTVPSYVE
eukprot:COSAG01_NODE_1056_length_11893_cov_439.683332_20_plen_41_part_01